MAEVHVDWRGADVLRTIEEALVAGLEDGGAVVVAEAQGLLGTPYPPSSRPGESPHRRSGTLQRQHSSRVVRIPGGAEAHIGPLGVVYAGPLHRGNAHLGGARPWLPQAGERATARVVAAVSDAVARAIGA